MMNVSLTIEYCQDGYCEYDDSCDLDSYGYDSRLRLFRLLSAEAGGLRRLDPGNLRQVAHLPTPHEMGTSTPPS